MNFVITETENIPTYLAIIGFTFVFSFLIWRTLFDELDVHEVKYTTKLKRRSLWLIFSNLLLLILWWRVFQLLLSRLQ